MAGEDERFPPRPVTPPNRRIGALSGNTKGISASKGTAAEAAPPHSADVDSQRPPVSQTATPPRRWISPCRTSAS